MTNLDGLPVLTRSGETVGYAVDALAGCANGRIDFLLIRCGGVGGVGEKLHRLPWSAARLQSGNVRTTLSGSDIDSLALASSDFSMRTDASV